MNKLGGYLVGYGIKKRNGSEMKVMFDHPLHNTITKHCLNNLLTFDGTDAVPTTNTQNNWLSLFVKSSGTSDRYGVFNYSALGDGTGSTSTSDTDLKNRVTAYTDTKKTGSDWCGTYWDDANAVVKLRIAHAHTITSAFTIKEIGWYNRFYGTDTYQLSARVVLDTPVPVESGDEFYTIYQVNWGFQGVERFNDFAGFGPGYKTNGLFMMDTYNAGWYFGIPYIDSNGIAVNGHYGTGFGNSSTFFQPAWLNINYGTRTVTGDWNKWLPIYWGGRYEYARSYMNDGSIIYAPKPYTADSFYRDIEITMDPSMIPTGDIYGFLINFTYYRFGTFDENDNFTATPVTLNGTLKCTVRQRWTTDLLSPSA